MPRRTLAAVLSFLYFTTNVVCAHSIESSLWTARRTTLTSRRAPLRSMSSTGPLRPLDLPDVARPSSILRSASRLSAVPADSPLALIPASAGVVLRFQPPRSPSLPTIALFQDVHLNPEAQRNLVAML